MQQQCLKKTVNPVGWKRDRWQYLQRPSQILLSILCLVHSLTGFSAELTSSNTNQLMVTHKGAQIVIPIPDGYVLADHRRLPIDELPQFQDRQILAALTPKITPGNEYSVAPEPGHSRPSYYLVYRPRLDFRPGKPDEVLTRLANTYYDRAFEAVSEDQRYALQRLDENTVSATWVDVSRYALERDEEAAKGSSINCINSIAYRKDAAILMFDTIEACGLDAAAVKNHGEAWLKRIKTANEPLSYGRKLLAEKGIKEKNRQENNTSAAQEANKPGPDEEEDPVSRPGEGFLWLLLVMLGTLLAWAGLQRWLASRVT